MTSASAHVLAVITTYRRPGLLRRLLNSLAATAGQNLRGIIVVDNADDEETAQIARNCPLLLVYLPQKENRGHGAGHAAGLRAGLAESAATHFWLLDDDAVAQPGTLTELLAVFEENTIEGAVPLLLNEAGCVGWFPGLRDSRRWRIIRRPELTPAGFLQACGPDPVRFTWTPWCMLLLTRAAVETIGLPRTDFGFMADDIEYSLRLTACRQAVLVPSAVGRHLPPAPKSGPHGYFTDCLNLQNMSYVMVQLPHGRRALRHLPGLYRRFFNRWGWGLARWRDAGVALWCGAVRAQTGGMSTPGNFYFRWRETLAQ